jgi:hypothetical protein
MDYNSEQFSFDFSPQHPLPALSTHTTPISTNTQPNPPIRNRRRQHIIVIDAIRLSNQGDISNSYSGDLIDNGKIRRPFSYNGNLYVTTSSAHGPSLCEAEAYQLLPEYLFDSEPITYANKIHHDGGETARHDPNGFYHGITITQQGRQYVLTGPPQTFIPNIPRI